MCVLPYSNTLGTTDYTQRWDQCRRLKFSLYVFESRSENVEKLYSNSLVNSIIQLLQTASHSPLLKRNCQQGLTQQHCSHNPVSLTLPYIQQMQNKADGSLHLSCSSWACCCRESLAPISRFPAWLLLMKVIRNEELCQWYGWSLRVGCLQAAKLS